VERSLGRRLPNRGGRSRGDARREGLPTVAWGVKIMRIRRVLLMAALLAVFVLAAPSVVNAASLRVTGTIAEVSPGTCGDFVLTGKRLKVHCEGLVETWAGGISGTGFFDERVSINIVSGELRVSGTETFVGCVGAVCGTLEWVYHGLGKFDLQTFEPIFINGEQHFTGGTGGLDGAKGSVMFALLGEGPATYQGFIVL